MRTADARDGLGQAPANPKPRARRAPRMDTPYGWAALVLGALAIVALVVLLRRLSRVEPDFSPLHAPPAAPTPPAEAPREE